MENKQIKLILILLMAISLTLSFFQPWVVATSVTLVFALIFLTELEHRHNDSLDAIRATIVDINEAIRAQSIQLTDLKELKTTYDRLDKEIKSFDPEKTKGDLKTLIESNNQIVMKMSMGSMGNAFGGMS